MISFIPGSNSASVMETTGLSPGAASGAERPPIFFVSRLALPRGMLDDVPDVTQILNAIEQGDPMAAEVLLPLVYDELRKLAASRLADDNAGQTLQATALVHEAYVRLVDVERAQNWNSRGHFFAAAAEAMRRILIDRARHKGTLKDGGGWRRLDLGEVVQAAAEESDDLLALDEALRQLEIKDRRKAELVKLRFFAGLTAEQAAAALGVSISTAEKDWAYARSWLRVAISRISGLQS